MSKLPGRIPFEDVEKFRNWAVPKVNGQVLASAEREAKKALMAGMPKQDHETVEEISAEQVSLGPMTADQLAQITDEASREGFNQGYEEGLEKGLVTGERQGIEQGKTQALAEWSAHLKAHAEHLANTCETLLNPVAEQRHRLTNELLNLSVLLAQQLLHEELSQNPAAYWGWVQEALAQLPSGRNDATLFLPTAVVEL
ncbi:MAG TPA: FliH/SctL family protein [Cellvibrionaceae bacterium]